MFAIEGGNMLFKASALLNSHCLPLGLLPVTELLEMLISSTLVSRLLTMDLTFIFVSYFIFSFPFLFLEQLGLGLSVTLSHQSQLDGVVTRLITGLRRMK